MRIALIDVDSRIPNLALMKLSTFYKNAGHEISLIRENLSFRIARKKHQIVAPANFDRVFASVIFSTNRAYVPKNIMCGGTGTAPDIKLPDFFETLDCDYSLYPENEFSWGFISRGCIRKCHFCLVPEFEGGLRQVNTIDNICKLKKTKFLDNNILALPNSLDIFRELADKQIAYQFNQGLDIRLITESLSNAIRETNYFGELYFAFDDVRLEKVISEKLKILNWRKPWRFKFFVYVHPNMTFEETRRRIEFLKSRELLPYIMRDAKCEDSPNHQFFKDLCAYCNQSSVFKKMDFLSFLEIRHSNLSRIDASWKLYNS